MRRPLQFRRQLFQFFLEGQEEVGRQGHVRREEAVKKQMINIE
jgi:hypothetical protein